MNNNTIIKKILWASIEDYVGLWEIYWEVDNDIDHDLNSLIEIIESLILNDNIRIYQSIWGKDNLNEVPQHEALLFIKNKTNWNPPSIGDMCVKIGCTDKGEDNYNNSYRIKELP